MTHVITKWLGQQDYQTTWAAMQAFTNARLPATIDEIWFLEHSPVFTQGQNGKAEHVLAPGNIPVVQTDRGGQVTYHGPGQLMVYVLADLKRQQLSIRDLVSALEQSVIDLLADEDVIAFAKQEAPGVYVSIANETHKLASIGLRVRKGLSYHGMAFNVNMDLSPFNRINPCGFSGLKMTTLKALMPVDEVQQAAKLLLGYLMKHLGYTSASSDG